MKDQMCFVPQFASNDIVIVQLVKLAVHVFAGPRLFELDPQSG